MLLYKSKTRKTRKMPLRTSRNLFGLQTRSFERRFPSIAQNSGKEFSLSRAFRVIEREIESSCLDVDFADSIDLAQKKIIGPRSLSVYHWRCAKARIRGKYEKRFCKHSREETKKVFPITWSFLCLIRSAVCSDISPTIPSS